MCALARMLYALVRWKRFRASLIRVHFAGCPRCGMGTPGAERWAGLVRPPEWVAREGSLWPEIERRMHRSVRPAPRRAPAPEPLLIIKLSAAAGGALALALLAVLVSKPAPRAPLAPSLAKLGQPRVEVLSVEIDDREGRSSVYQTDSASFVWLYPGPANGGRK